LVTSSGVHNALIRGWLAGGIATFIGLLIIYLLAIKKSLISLRDFINKDSVSYLQVGLSISVLSWILIDMAQPSFYQRFTWITVCVLYGLTFNKKGSWIQTS